MKTGLFEKHFSDQISVIVLSSFGDQVTFKTQVKIILLLVAFAVVGDCVAMGDRCYMRPITNQRLDRQVKFPRKQPAQGSNFPFDELSPPSERRELVHGCHNPESEIVRYQVVEYLWVCTVEVLEKSTRLLALLLCIQNAVPPRIVRGMLIERLLLHLGRRCSSAMNPNFFSHHRHAIHQVGKLEFVGTDNFEVAWFTECLVQLIEIIEPQFGDAVVI
jgi:hypothetical protein